MMMNVYPRSDSLIYYPQLGLINSNLLIMHNYSYSVQNPTFKFALFGGLKCRGYSAQTNDRIIIFSFTPILLIHDSLINNLLCANQGAMVTYRDFVSPHKNDECCQNDSLTFNGRPYAVNSGICTFAGYRIRDGSYDCFDSQDEKLLLKENYCTGNAGKHRFQCFNDEHKCLPLHSLSSADVDCSNSYDRSWYGTGTELRLQLLCIKGLTTNCHLVKAYIQQSSATNSSKNKVSE